MSCLTSALTASCCHQHTHICHGVSQGLRQGLHCVGVGEGDVGHHHVKNVFKEPLAFVISARQHVLGPGAGTGNSPQLLQAGGGFEGLGKAVAADVTKVVPTQAGEAENRPGAMVGSEGGGRGCATNSTACKAFTRLGAHKPVIKLREEGRARWA